MRITRIITAPVMLIALAVSPSLATVIDSINAPALPQTEPDPALAASASPDIVSPPVLLEPEAGLNQPSSDTPKLEFLLAPATESTSDNIKRPDINGVAVNPGSPIINRKSKAREWIDFNVGRLTNNVWGAPSDEKLTSGVYLKENGNFGWYWDRQNPKKSGLSVKPLYPNLRIGGCPWEASKSAYFPIKVGDIKSLKLDVSFNYQQIPTGSYNLSYDMFLLDTHEAGPSPKIKAEVMIWLQATKKQVFFTYKGDFSDGYNTYELYSWVMADGRLYYSFILKAPLQYQDIKTVDAKVLLDNLQLNPAWYVPGIELGNEVFDGSGEIEINKLKVNLNGQDL